MAMGINLGGLILVLGAFSLISIGVILLAKWSGLFDALSMLNQWLQTAIHWVGRVTSWAPRIVQIGLFVLVAGTMVVMLSDVFVTPTHVCSEGNVYSGGFFNVMTAKLLASDRSVEGQLAQQKEQSPGILAKFGNWVKSMVVSADPAADFEKSKNDPFAWGTFSGVWADIKNYRSSSSGVTSGVSTPDGAFLDNTLVFFFPLENLTDAGTLISMQAAFGITDCRPSYNPWASQQKVCTTDSKYGANGIKAPAGGFDPREFTISTAIVKYDYGYYKDRCVIEQQCSAGWGWCTLLGGNTREMIGLPNFFSKRQEILTMEYSFATLYDQKSGLSSQFHVTKAERDFKKPANGWESFKSFLDLFSTDLLAGVLPNQMTLTEQCGGIAQGPVTSTGQRPAVSCGPDEWYVQTGPIHDVFSGQTLAEESGCVVGRYVGIRTLGGTEEQVVNGRGSANERSLSSRQQFIDTLREGDKESFVLQRDETAVKFSCDAKDEVFFSVFGVNPFTPTFLYAFMGLLGFFWLLRLFGLI